MREKLFSTLKWLPHYLKRELERKVLGRRGKARHVYFCICDHFEPYWKGADCKTARQRINRWIKEYPKVAESCSDSDGNILKYTFFYPEEEYQESDMNALSELCHAGYGEVEVHLHHNNDTSDNLRRTLLDFKHRLHEKHGLLSVDKETGEISYGFIHGNWALDNSRPDGSCCGVNNEISILQETGCYADFTMPSAPDSTQTRKVNSIYYAIDNPAKPKSHDCGIDAEVGKRGEGLLIVQGPLGLNLHNRKYGILPRIENGGLISSNPMRQERARIWIDQGVCVQGVEDHIFVKIYTHGAQENIMHMLFNDAGLEAMLNHLKAASYDIGADLHFVSAREMVNIICAFELGAEEDMATLKDWRYRKAALLDA